MNDLPKLFRHGILCNSPDFTHEKQPDGRYQVRLKLAPESVVNPTVAPTGTITVEAFITELSPLVEYHLGPASWFLIPNALEITHVGQYKVNADPLYTPYFKAGVDIGAGFEIAPNYVSIGTLDPVHRFVQVFARNDSTDWDFEVNTGGGGALEATADLSTGVFDQIYGFLFNYNIRLIVTYTRGPAA